MKKKRNLSTVIWKIKKKDANKIIRSLLECDEEIGGSFTFDDNLQTEDTIVQKGTKTNVKTPLGLLNFHTHPLKAYQMNNAVYGHPSADDMRECIRFAMKGNFCHVVFTLEGIYTIQVRPWFTKLLRNKLNHHERGILIFSIEEFFRKFHVRRTIQYLQQHGVRKHNPFVFTDICNDFCIQELTNTPLSIKEVIPLNKNGDIEHSAKNKKSKQTIQEIKNIAKKNKVDQNDYIFYVVFYVADNMYNVYEPQKRWQQIKGGTIDPKYSDDDLNVKFIKLDKRKKEHNTKTVIEKIL